VGIIGATLAPIDMTGIEIRTKTEIGTEIGIEIGIGTEIGMVTTTVGTNGKTGRVWNEIESKLKGSLTRKTGESTWADEETRQGRFSRKELNMLWTIFVILLIMWALGLATSYTLGGFIHILLVIAVVMLVINLVQGRRV